MHGAKLGATIAGITAVVVGDNRTLSGIGVAMPLWTGPVIGTTADAGCELGTCGAFRCRAAAWPLFLDASKVTGIAANTGVTCGHEAVTVKVCKITGLEPKWLRETRNVQRNQGANHVK